MKFDIVIVGGGLVGASLAAALKHSGLALALVESQPSLMPDVAPASNVRFPIPNPDGTTGHSTRPPKDGSQVAGYPPQTGEGAIESLRELPSNDWDSRIYAISPGSRCFLEQSGAGSS